MISQQELAERLQILFKDCSRMKDFLHKKEEVRSIASCAGGALDSYEQEGLSIFDVRISRVTGWGSDALYSHKFKLAIDSAMAAE